MGERGPCLLRKVSGAEGQNRTADTMIFSHVLYRLSYLGTSGKTAQRVGLPQADTAVTILHSEASVQLGWLLRVNLRPRVVWVIVVARVTGRARAQPATLGKRGR